VPGSHSSVIHSPSFGQVGHLYSVLAIELQLFQSERWPLCGFSHKPPSSSAEQCFLWFFFYFLFSIGWTF